MLAPQYFFKSLDDAFVVDGGDGDAAVDDGTVGGGGGAAVDDDGGDCSVAVGGDCENVAAADFDDPIPFRWRWCFARERW